MFQFFVDFGLKHIEIRISFSSKMFETKRKHQYKIHMLKFSSSQWQSSIKINVFICLQKSKNNDLKLESLHCLQSRYCHCEKWKIQNILSSVLQNCEENLIRFCSMSFYGGISYIIYGIWYTVYHITFMPHSILVISHLALQIKLLQFSNLTLPLTLQI